MKIIKSFNIIVFLSLNRQSFLDKIESSTKMFIIEIMSQLNLNSFEYLSERSLYDLTSCCYTPPQIKSQLEQIKNKNMIQILSDLHICSVIDKRLYLLSQIGQVLKCDHSNNFKYAIINFHPLENESPDLYEVLQVDMVN